MGSDGAHSAAFPPARFYGGSRDGQTLNDHCGARILVASGEHHEVTETYVRDRERYVRNADGEITELAYRLESVERIA
jgi:hypothetical protein